MSLLLIDGFDDGLATSKWTTVTGTTQLWTVARTGLGSLRWGDNGHWIRKIVPTVDKHITFIAGGAFSFLTFGWAGSIIDFLGDLGVTLHCRLYVNTDRSVSFYRGSTVLATTAAGVIPASGYVYIEMKCTLHDTTGNYEIRVNGVNVLSATGVDTKNAGTDTTFDTLRIIGNAAGGSSYDLDDVYFCNGAGTLNNDFLGDIQVRTLFPSGNGAFSQLTGSDGNSTDNYLLVDESGAAPSSADYVGSATPGQMDTYLYPDIATGSIKGIAHTSWAAKSEPGSTKLRQLVRLSGTNYVGSDVAPGVGYLGINRLLEVNPATGVAWTLADLNGAEFGIEVRS